MCVHQAVEAFTLLSGVKPDVARLYHAFANGLAARDAATAATPVS
jgi:shikimate 5-dehydrogenase